MESKQFIEYINTNIYIILSNLKKNLDISQEESIYLINLIIKDLLNDEYYSRLINSKLEFFPFEESTIQSIKKIFISVGIDESEIKKIILTIPEILLFYDSFESIYLIYKSSKFSGIAFLNGEDYRAYSYSESSFRLRYLNIALDSRINDFTYLIEKLLRSLDREDIKKTTNLESQNKEDLKNRFMALTRSNSKKNYYLRKKQWVIFLWDKIIFFKNKIKKY